MKLNSTGVLTSDGKWLYRIVGLARDADTQVDFVDNDRLMLAPSLTYRPTKDTSITVLGNFRNDDSGSALQFLPAGRHALSQQARAHRSARHLPGRAGRLL